MRPRSIDEQTIAWEQEQNFYGYTPGRPYGTGFGQIARQGFSRLSTKAVPYGEEKVMDEEFMLTARQMGEFGDRVNLTDQQMSDQLNLVSRMITLYKYNVWNLLTTGTYKALGPKGELVGTDSYNFGSFTAAVDWSNYASATPLLDLRTGKLKHRGQSASFGRKSKLYMQSQDVNNLLSNTNPNDLGAKRVITNDAGAQPMSLKDVNRFLLDDDLPEIVEYDESYATGTASTTAGVPPFTMFIPAGTAVWIGARDYGDPIMDYTMTPTFGKMFGKNGGARTGNGPASAWSNIYFEFILDMKDWQAKSRIAFSGAPRVLFPSAVLTVNLQP